MGTLPSQRFAEFRDYLPIKCECGEGRYVNMNKDVKKYKPRLLYICSNCGHAIWIGDFEQSGQAPPNHIKKVF